MRARRLASPRWRRLRTAAAVSLACAAIAQPAWPAAQTFNTALPVAQRRIHLSEAVHCAALGSESKPRRSRGERLRRRFGAGVWRHRKVGRVWRLLRKELEVNSTGGVTRVKRRIRSFPGGKIRRTLQPRQRAGGPSPRARHLRSVATLIWRCFASSYSVTNRGSAVVRVRD